MVLYLAHVVPGLLRLDEWMALDMRMLLWLYAKVMEQEKTRVKVRATAMRMAFGGSKEEFTDYIHSLDPVELRKRRQKDTWETLALLGGTRNGL